MLFVSPARLRADPKVRAAYEALKRELAMKHANDREAYTRAKADFLVGVLRDAAKAA
jgi:GrpB-like predicted nucleotidyltransferase (UPF0157 family)